MLSRWSYPSGIVADPTLSLCSRIFYGPSTPIKASPKRPPFLLPTAPPYSLFKFICFSPNLIHFHVSPSSAFCTCHSLCQPYSLPLLYMANPTSPLRSSSNASLPVFPRRGSGDFLGPFMVLCTHLHYSASHMLGSMSLCGSLPHRPWVPRLQGLYLFHFSLPKEAV